jgi:hypothetical protein
MEKVGWLKYKVVKGIISCASLSILTMKRIKGLSD